MPDISDLPDEVLGLMLQLAVAPTDRWYLNSHQQRLAVPIGQLRLVCRRWSHWLTEQHFNQELYILSGTSAMRSSSTKFLGRVWRSLMCGPNAKSYGSTSSGLGGLYLYSNLNFQLPFAPNFCHRGHKIPLIIIKTSFTIIVSTASAPCLRQLQDLGVSISSRLNHQVAGNLKIRFGPHSTGEHHPSSDQINISIRLKSSLEMLSISSSPWDDCHQLLPIFETLEDKLGGLSIAHSKVWNPVAHSKFSALRLMNITHWDGCLPDFWQLDMFSYAPIEVLVLSGDHIVKQKADHPASLVDPLQNYSR
ncbi:hypothetical protein KEM48_004617 [Puccinia striiformis f. sp. tritici PST-130]|nr:hypothetical protein KEM48_004617 [Puccinia striiformis f. sp. tritici PST-130]